MLGGGAALGLASVFWPDGAVPARAQDIRAEDVASVRVEKSARRLLLLDGQDRILREYSGIQLGDAPVGHKQFEGDERTPEGRYVIDHGNPASAYHLSLHISYPNARDRAFAESRGRSPGGQIFIHGQPNGLPAGKLPGDWTDGCIALSNAEIEQLWSLVGDGTPIEITP
ncbi:L,D-transpeptidase family protein [Novosphingobium sp. SL115]|uniref:L,D-transpeptidase family protein n=1 Tax=Novosphingobium sp. SL115 TaxID=2995150 RepID=UPI002275EFF9|nr:L,D-transpeptidase family protein [Novosphingobium sp. SL115]MCY1669740.1 L,D-transpeptidase family protein [Novosphingobium sp. SL115]